MVSSSAGERSDELWTHLAGDRSRGQRRMPDDPAQNSTDGHARSRHPVHLAQSVYPLCEIDEKSTERVRTKRPSRKCCTSSTRFFDAITFAAVQRQHVR